MPQVNKGLPCVDLSPASTHHWVDFFFFFFIGVYSLRRMLPFVLSNIKIVGGTNTKTNKQTTNKPTIIELGRDKNN